MSHYSDAQDVEFSTAVAAAAFAIHSNEEARLQYQKGMRESLQISRTKTLQDAMAGRPSSGELNRRLSNKEAKNAGEASMRKPVGQDQRTLKSAFPSRYPNRASSTRPSTPADGYQNRKGSSTGHNTLETEADAWEKAQIKKIQRRYDKVKSAILAWEHEKKMQAKIKMEKRKSELEQRRASNMQHYQIKQTRIDQIAGGARAQMEEKRRNEESKVREKVKRIRSKGKVPVKCFCFTCY